MAIQSNTPAQDDDELELMQMQARARRRRAEAEARALAEASAALDEPGLPDDPFSLSGTGHSLVNGIVEGGATLAGTPISGLNYVIDQGVGYAQDLIQGTSNQSALTRGSGVIDPETGQPVELTAPWYNPDADHTDWYSNDRPLLGINHLQGVARGDLDIQPGLGLGNLQEGTGAISDAARAMGFDPADGFLVDTGHTPGNWIERRTEDFGRELPYAVPMLGYGARAGQLGRVGRAPGMLTEGADRFARAPIREGLTEVAANGVAGAAAGGAAEEFPDNQLAPLVASLVAPGVALTAPALARRSLEGVEPALRGAWDTVSRSGTAQVAGNRAREVGNMAVDIGRHVTGRPPIDRSTAGLPDIHPNEARLDTHQRGLRDELIDQGVTPISVHGMDENSGQLMADALTDVMQSGRISPARSEAVTEVVRQVSRSSDTHARTIRNNVVGRQNSLEDRAIRLIDEASGRDPGTRVDAQRQARRVQRDAESDQAWNLLRDGDVDPEAFRTRVAPMLEERTVRERMTNVARNLDSMADTLHAAGDVSGSTTIRNSATSLRRFYRHADARAAVERAQQGLNTARSPKSRTAWQNRLADAQQAVRALGPQPIVNARTLDEMRRALASAEQALRRGATPDEYMAGQIGRVRRAFVEAVSEATNGRMQEALDAFSRPSRVDDLEDLGAAIARQGGTDQTMTPAAIEARLEQIRATRDPNVRAANVQAIRDGLARELERRALSNVNAPEGNNALATLLGKAGNNSDIVRQINVVFGDEAGNRLVEGFRSLARESRSHRRYLGRPLEVKGVDPDAVSTSQILPALKRILPGSALELSGGLHLMVVKLAKMIFLGQGLKGRGSRDFSRIIDELGGTLGVPINPENKRYLQDLLATDPRFQEDPFMEGEAEFSAEMFNDVVDAAYPTTAERATVALRMVQAGRTATAAASIQAQMEARDAEARRKDAGMEKRNKRTTPMTVSEALRADRTAFRSTNHAPSALIGAADRIAPSKARPTPQPRASQFMSGVEL